MCPCSLELRYSDNGRAHDTLARGRRNRLHGGQSGAVLRVMEGFIIRNDGVVAAASGVWVVEGRRRRHGHGPDVRPVCRYFCFKWLVTRFEFMVLKVRFFLCQAPLLKFDTSTINLLLSMLAEIVMNCLQETLLIFIFYDL